jgi:HlyD family secretion protein
VKWLRIVLGVAIVGGVLALAVNGLKERPPPSVEVQLGKARRGPIARVVTGAGKIEAATTVKLSSNLSGDLIELAVRVGDRVTKGQVLGRLDRRRIEASVKQATAALSAAKAEIHTIQVEVERFARERQRVQGLVDKGLASTAELERLTSDVESARARSAAQNDRAAQAAAAQEEAKNTLSKTTLFSPIDGNVIEVTREVGERVRGSDFNEDVVMTLAALHVMEVKIEVGEHEVVHLAIGQKADVKIDAIEGQTFGGTVVEIAQKALIRNPGTEQETTSFPVTVALGERPEKVLPGMSGEVRITSEQRDMAIVVPVQAVSVRPSKSLPDAKIAVEKAGLVAPKKGETFAKVVFVVDEAGVAHARRVKTGIASDTDIEIVEGVSEGEQIVEGPYRTLAKELNDGDHVEKQQDRDGRRRPRGS